MVYLNGIIDIALIRNYIISSIDREGSPCRGIHFDGSLNGTVVNQNIVFGKVGLYMSNEVNQEKLITKIVGLKIRNNSFWCINSAIIEGQQTLSYGLEIEKNLFLGCEGYGILLKGQILPISNILTHLIQGNCMVVYGTGVFSDLTRTAKEVVILNNSINLIGSLDYENKYGIIAAHSNVRIEGNLINAIRLDERLDNLDIPKLVLTSAVAKKEFGNLTLANGGILIGSPAISRIVGIIEGSPQFNIKTIELIRQADGTVVDKTAAETLSPSPPDIKLQKFTFDKIEGGIYKLRFIQDEQTFFETDAFIIEPAVLIHTLFFMSSDMGFMLAPVATSNTTNIKQILVRNNQITNGSQNGITIAALSVENLIIDGNMIEGFQLSAITASSINERKYTR